MSDWALCNHAGERGLGTSRSSLGVDLETGVPTLPEQWLCGFIDLRERFHVWWASRPSWLSSSH
eukprot:1643196-Pleurochrysis_carterae.AAC.1